MDDDTEFWGETRVERLLEVFPRAPDVSLVAGSYAQPHKRSPPDFLERTQLAKDSEEFRRALTRNVKGLFVGINAARCRPSPPPPCSRLLSPSLRRLPPCASLRPWPR